MQSSRPGPAAHACSEPPGPPHVGCKRSICLPLYDMQYFISWSYTKNEFFSVRSANFVKWDHQNGEKLRGTNGMDRTNFNLIWCKIWKLSCSTKVKISICRTLH